MKKNLVLSIALLSLAACGQNANIASKGTASGVTAQNGGTAGQLANPNAQAPTVAAGPGDGGTGSTGGTGLGGNGGPGCFPGGNCPNGGSNGGPLVGPGPHNPGGGNGDLGGNGGPGNGGLGGNGGDGGNGGIGGNGTPGVNGTDGTNGGIGPVIVVGPGPHNPGGNGGDGGEFPPLVGPGPHNPGDGDGGGGKEPVVVVTTPPPVVTIPVPGKNGENGKPGKPGRNGKNGCGAPQLVYDAIPMSIKDVNAAELPYKSAPAHTIDIKEMGQANRPTGEIVDAQVLFKFPLQLPRRDTLRLRDAYISLSVAKYINDGYPQTELICFINEHVCSGKTYTESEKTWQDNINKPFFQGMVLSSIFSTEVAKSQAGHISAQKSWINEAMYLPLSELIKGSKYKTPMDFLYDDAPSDIAVTKTMRMVVADDFLVKSGTKLVLAIDQSDCMSGGGDAVDEDSSGDGAEAPDADGQPMVIQGGPQAEPEVPQGKGDSTPEIPGLDAIGNAIGNDGAFSDIITKIPKLPAGAKLPNR